jgi:hypothetical protein
MIFYNFEIAPYKFVSVDLLRRRRVFLRVSAPTVFAATMAPPGKSGICVEFTCKQGDERWQHPERHTQAMIDDLVRTKTIDHAGQIQQVHVERVPFTYPIYKLNYFGELTRNLRQLAGFKNMLLAGRCGRFWYNNMDHSIGQGLTMSDKILKGQILSAIDTSDREFWAADSEGVGGGTAERRRRAEADRSRVVSARIALRILPSGGRGGATRRWRSGRPSRSSPAAATRQQPDAQPGQPVAHHRQRRARDRHDARRHDRHRDGHHFAAGATVTIGGTAATNVAVQSATTLTADTPARRRRRRRVGHGSRAQRLDGQGLHVRRPRGVDQPAAGDQASRPAGRPGCRRASPISTRR